MYPEDRSKFGLWDYAVFALTLILSCAVGIYHAFRKKNKTTEEFLFAGRSVGLFPLAMSQMATVASSVTMLATPAEMNLCGIQYSLSVVAYLIVAALGAFIFLPRFFDSKVNSIMEYFERRFNRTIRLCSAICCLVPTILYLAVLIYIPALAINQVIGIGIWESIAPMAISCILYTSVGGFRTVVWTDVFQSFIMVASVLLMVIKGIIHVGGISVVWERIVEGERNIWINWQSTPTTRYSWWSITFGNLAIYTYVLFGNQTMVQRYVSTKNVSQSRKSLLVGALAYAFLQGLGCLLGLVIYANYYRCDPLESGVISAMDQIVPKFAMDVIGFLPGLPGLYVGGILAATLSTFSSGINAMSLIIMEDCIKLFKPNISEKRSRRILFLLGIAIGLVCLLCVLAMQHFNSGLQAVYASYGTVGGAVVGLLLLGMLVPWATTRGAIIGCVTSIAFTVCIIVGTQHSGYVLPSLPVSTTECDKFGLNITTSSNTTANYIEHNSQVFPLFKIAPISYVLIGICVLLPVGSIASILCGPQNPNDLPYGVVSPTSIKLCLKLPRNIRRLLGFEMKVSDSDKEETVAMNTISNGKPADDTTTVSTEKHQNSAHL